MHRIVRLTRQPYLERWLATAALLGGVLEACGGDSDPASSSGAVKTASGGGGAPSTASTAGSGGPGDARAYFKRKAGPAELSSDISASACPGSAPKPGALDGLAECSGICGSGRCIDAARVGGTEVAIPDCPAGSGNGPTKCFPEKLIEWDLKWVPRECTYSLTGQNGVCVPACLIADAGAMFLNRDTCGEAEYCAPCTDITGQVTTTCMDRCVK